MFKHRAYEMDAFCVNRCDTSEWGWMAQPSYHQLQEYDWGRIPGIYYSYIHTIVQLNETMHSLMYSVSIVVIEYLAPGIVNSLWNERAFYTDKVNDGEWTVNTCSNGSYSKKKQLLFTGITVCSQSLVSEDTWQYCWTCMRKEIVLSLYVLIPNLSTIHIGSPANMRICTD
jgi:hypothetical protein